MRRGNLLGPSIEGKRCTGGLLRLCEPRNDRGRFVCSAIIRHKRVAILIPLCYNTLTMQGSYIGNTTASQALVLPGKNPCSARAFSIFWTEFSKLSHYLLR